MEQVYILHRSRPPYLVKSEYVQPCGTRFEMGSTGPSSFLQQLVLQVSIFRVINPLRWRDKVSSFDFRLRMKLLTRYRVKAQILANLQWLCEFQVLACIPLDGEVAFEEVADISNVSVDHLQRVVRLMTTAGFLREQTSGHVSHTALSASFVTEPDLLDAALFLAQVAVPVALKSSHMAHLSAPYSHDQLSAMAVQPEGRLMGLAGDFDPSQPKIHRQFAAYLAHGILDESSAVDEVLRLIDWDAIGAKTVVDVRTPYAIAAYCLTLPYMRSPSRMVHHIGPPPVDGHRRQTCRTCARCPIYRANEFPKQWPFGIDDGIRWWQWRPILDDFAPTSLNRKSSYSTDAASGSLANGPRGSSIHSANSFTIPSSFVGDHTQSDHFGTAGSSPSSSRTA